MNQIVEKATVFQGELESIRQALHMIPEIGVDLPLTTKYVKEKLEEMGYQPTEICQSGLVVVIGGKKPGKNVLLRADMDGLPLKDETTLEYKSTNDNMHACGHDLHTTMLLGVAMLLKDCQDDLEGSIKLMFQPGEETLEGAKMMIESGVLDNPKVDAAVSLHVFSGMPLPSGMFMLPKGGASTAASDGFEIVVHGKGGHGAMPNTAIDPLNVISHIHLALQTINSREIDPNDGAVVTAGIIEGGSAHNIIPDKARMAGSIRTFSKQNREMIPKRVIEISKNIAETFRATADVNIIEGCPSTVNDEEVSTIAKQALYEAFNKEIILDMGSIIPNGGKMMGSEDFSFVSQEVPSIMMGLSAGNSNEGYVYPMHHPKVKFDEKTLSLGAAGLTSIALKMLKEY